MFSSYTMQKRLSRVAIYVVLVALALFFLYPAVFMLVLSLQPDETQIAADMGTIFSVIPRTISLENFVNVFERVNFGRAFLNSIFIVGMIIGLGMIVNSMIAYALARMRWAGRNVVLGIIVALIIIPFEAVAVPLLLLTNRLGWLDSYHVQIIPFVANPLHIFLFYQFFIGLPKEIEEAALVDGASRFRVYWQIIVPLSGPVFATVAILGFLAQWGQFLWPLMVTRGETFRPLPVAMQTFYGQAPFLWGDRLAFAVMMTLPTVIVFLIFQKWFVQSVASSGVKG
ncbi:MAG TPA: carbohydrate ABC transporter permease [Anaerolineaceae bacterium]|nr:carbohydrate ABC transporter permease [Anaerolineaceae bacterium]HPN53245.1 carbohydrate ABC transporter permease [Anaerolineaceae bacterium]